MFSKKVNHKMFKETATYFCQFLFFISVLALVYLFADNQIKTNADGQYPPMIKIEDNYYLLTGHTLKDVDEEQLVQIQSWMR